MTVYSMRRLSMLERIWYFLNPRARREYEARLIQTLAYLVKHPQIRVETA